MAVPQGGLINSANIFVNAPHNIYGKSRTVQVRLKTPISGSLVRPATKQKLEGNSQ